MKRKRPAIGFGGMMMLILGWVADWPALFVLGAAVLVYALFVGHVKVFG